MKTNLPNQLTNVDDIERFIADLILNDEMFHLDDDAHDIINGHTNRPLFTSDEADKVNALLEQAFNICDVWELPTVIKFVDSGVEE